MLDSECALALAVYEEKRDKLHSLLSTFKGFKVTVRSIEIAYTPNFDSAGGDGSLSVCCLCAFHLAVVLFDPACSVQPLSPTAREGDRAAPPSLALL